MEQEKEKIIQAYQKGILKMAEQFALKFQSLIGDNIKSNNFGKLDAEKYFEDTYNKQAKKVEKARPVYWIKSKQKGKKAGYLDLEKAKGMISTFQQYFPADEFYIESEMPVDGLVVAASYIGTNNKNNEAMPFKGWVGDYAKKRMADLYGEKSNYIS